MTNIEKAVEDLVVLVAEIDIYLDEQGGDLDPFTASELAAAIKLVKGFETKVDFARIYAENA